MADKSNELTDANSRLKARLRPSVAPRQTSILNRVDEGANVELQVHQPEEGTSEHAKQKSTSASIKSQKDPKLTAFTLRVEEGLDKGLKSLCADEAITKETFLEAAYLACRGNKQIMEEILVIARERRQQRKNTGVQRRARAMSRYLED